MEYGKLIDGNLVRYKPPIRQGGYDIYVTDPTPYGYKEVVIPTPPTEAGKIAQFDGWEETETQIIQKWVLVDAPATEEDYKSALNVLGVVTND